MILAFMIAYSYSIIFYRLLRNKVSPQLVSEDIVKEDITDDEFHLAYDGSTFWEDGVFRFAPPVYIQRYIVVRDLLERLGPFKKVVDLGCSDLSFFNYLKNLGGTEELLLVDQDEGLLKQRRDCILPLNIDYLKRRETKLVVKILHGNAAVPDANLAGSLAIVAIELIEHMFPPDLDNLPYTLFGIIQPEVVIITTPNYDFNVVFKRTDFRHWDHKFEWTRLQFKDWVDNLVVRFPNYMSKLYGIGPGPEGTSEYGTCTQMVLFQRKSIVPFHSSHFFENSYHVISEVVYPYEKKIEIKLEDQVKYEAEKFILYAVNYESYHTNDRIEIPLSSIMRMVTRHTDSKEFLQAVLIENKWEVEEGESGEKCVVLPSSGIPFSSSSSECMEINVIERGSNSDVNEYNEFCDGNWTQSNFICGSDGGWSDAEDDATAPGLPLTCLNNESSNLMNCMDSSLNDFSVNQKGCDQKTLSNLVDPLGVNLDDRYNVKSSSQFEATYPVNLFSAPEKMSEQKPDMETLPKNVSLEGCVTLESPVEGSKLINKVSSKDLPLADGEITNISNTSDCDIPSVSYKLVCGSMKPPTTSGSDCLESKSDSFDIEQKLENESSDKFDESLIPSHNIKNDMFSVKRSLDLPLKSVVVNMNGNFEIGSPVCRVQREAKPSCFGLETSESRINSGNSKPSKNVFSSGISDFGSINSNIINAGSSSCMSNTDGCLFSSDLKGTVYSDCREKVDLRGGCINRCLSLQHIKEKEGGTKSNRFSLCCEKENINICDIFKDSLRTKSCGHSFDEVIDLLQADTVPNFDDSCSQSKAADSGYPNTSDREIDMDLTPEQVDELLSENESSLDEREEEEHGGHEGVGGAAPIQFLDHVENGDVANNNRDGEGNNLDQEEVGQPLHFQQLIQEEANNPPLDELPPHQESDSDNEDKFLSCTSMIYDTTLTVDETLNSEQIRTTLGWIATDTPYCPLTEECTSPDSSAILASSSTSLQVHPSSSDTLSLAHIDHFPPWLLNMLVDEVDTSRNDTLVGDQPSNVILTEVLSHSSLQDEDWSELVVPGDILGGGEPHSEL